MLQISSLCVPCHPQTISTNICFRLLVAFLISCELLRFPTRMLYAAPLFALLAIVALPVVALTPGPNFVRLNKNDSVSTSFALLPTISVADRVRWLSWPTSKRDFSRSYVVLYLIYSIQLSQLGTGLRPDSVPQQHDRPRSHRKGLQYPHRLDYERRARPKWSLAKGDYRYVPQCTIHSPQWGGRCLGQPRFQSRSCCNRQEPGYPCWDHYWRLYVFSPYPHTFNKRYVS